MFFLWLAVPLCCAHVTFKPCFFAYVDTVHRNVLSALEDNTPSSVSCLWVCLSSWSLSTWSRLSWIPSAVSGTVLGLHVGLEECLLNASMVVISYMCPQRSTNNYVSIFSWSGLYFLSCREASSTKNRFSEQERILGIIYLISSWESLVYCQIQ